MPLLPKPYPDEVVGSVITRGVWRSGLPFDVFIRGFFGSSTSASFLLGSEINRIAASAGMQSEDFLMRHTVFPYGTAYFTPILRELYRSQILSEADSVRCCSTLTKNVSHGTAYRRVCPQCVREERLALGESYWHLTHQLPAVFMCLQHMRPLANTPVALNGNIQFRDTLLPHMLPARTPRLAAREEVLIELTKTSLAAQLEMRGLGDGVYDAYRRRAIELGFCRSFDAIASAALTRSFNRFFGQELLTLTGCQNVSRAHWPKFMARVGKTVSFSTTKHVLMHTFLNLTKPFQGDVREGLQKTGVAKLDVRDIDKALSLQLKAEIEKARSAGTRITLTALLQKTDSLSHMRYRRDQLPLSSEVVAEFSMSELCARKFTQGRNWGRYIPNRATFHPEETQHHEKQ